MRHSCIILAMQGVLQSGQAGKRVDSGWGGVAQHENLLLRKTAALWRLHCPPASDKLSTQAAAVPAPQQLWAYHTG